MLVENAKVGKTVKEKMKNRIVYSICLIVLGLVSVLLGIGNFLPVEMSDYISGFYTGMGTGLVVGGIMLIVRNVRVLKDEKLMKEREIYENDERNRMIGLKTWSYTGYIMLLVLYAGMLVGGFIGELVLNTILVIIGIYSLCIFLTGLYVKKTM